MEAETGDCDIGEKYPDHEKPKNPGDIDLFTVIAARLETAGASQAGE